jgi:uncharacterized membrane protein YcfT
MNETGFCHNRIMSGVNNHAGRVDWVDYAKGFCIVFVVMMHSTLGVEAAVGKAGWLHPLVEFARPFRMPDFFMISGCSSRRRSTATGAATSIARSRISATSICCG